MSVDIATLGRCVVWFSAGAASTVAAKLALVDRPDALICYIDTGSEHEDTPRYLADVSAWLGRPITVLRSSEYRDVDDVIAHPEPTCDMFDGYVDDPCRLVPLYIKEADRA